MTSFLIPSPFRAVGLFEYAGDVGRGQPCCDQPRSASPSLPYGTAPARSRFMAGAVIVFRRVGCYVTLIPQLSRRVRCPPALTAGSCHRAVSIAILLPLQHVCNMRARAATTPPRCWPGFMRANISSPLPDRCHRTDVDRRHHEILLRAFRLYRSRAFPFAARNSAVYFTRW